MKLLALDSSTQCSSVALWDSGETRQHLTGSDVRQTRQLLPAANALLQEAGWNWSDLDALAVARGPGGFTGLRVAVGLAQGLALSLQLPLVPVSSLAALAQQAWRRFGSSRVLAALDARLDEVYWGGFGCAEQQIPKPLIPEQVGKLLCNVPEGSWCGIGNAWSLADIGQRLSLAEAVDVCDPQAVPEAEDVVNLAAGLLQQPAHDWQAAYALPVYLRDQVAGRRDSSKEHA